MQKEVYAKKKKNEKFIQHPLHAKDRAGLGQNKSRW